MIPNLTQQPNSHVKMEMLLDCNFCIGVIAAVDNERQKREL